MLVVEDFLKQFKPRVVSTISYSNGKYIKVEYGLNEIYELLEKASHRVYAYQWFEESQLLVLSI